MKLIFDLGIKIQTVFSKNKKQIHIFQGFYNFYSIFYITYVIINSNDIINNKL